VGALIGGWNRVPLEPMVRFGTYLGTAFQIQDDLLNLVGDEAVYGKEILGDLYEGKCTLMLVHLLNELDGTERRDLIDGFLASPRDARTDADVRHVLALMHREGSIEFARHFAEGIRSAALAAFDPAFALASPSADRHFLRDMVAFMLDRPM
jgi:geranylgeranyl diphosphate synthase, type II